MKFILHFCISLTCLIFFLSCGENEINTYRKNEINFWSSNVPATDKPAINYIISQKGGFEVSIYKVFIRILDPLTENVKEYDLKFTALDSSDNSITFKVNEFPNETLTIRLPSNKTDVFSARLSFSGQSADQILEFTRNKEKLK